MRVLLVTHGIKDASTAVYRNTLGRAKFLAGLGHDASVLTPDDVGCRGHGRLLPIVFPVAAAWWILRRAPFDTIAFHSHTGWVFQLVRRLIAAHRHTRVAVTFHGLDILYVRAVAIEGRRRGRPQSLRFRVLHEYVLPTLARWSCRHASRVFCMNERERRFLLEQRWTDERRLRLMANCVEAAAFVARQPASGPVRLLTVAQWLPVKGIPYVVKAFATVVRNGYDVELTCAGTRHEASEVLATFPPDVRSRVRVVPQAAHEDLPRFYAAADVFVLGSISEGFSIALLEAMAAGLAIVCTDVGAAAEILDAGRDASIVPPADADALASAIERLVRDPACRREYGTRARDRATAFTCERILPRFADDLLRDDAVAAAVAV